MNDSTIDAFANSSRNCFTGVSLLKPNCAKHTPRFVAAMTNEPHAESRYA